jgi:hypothetical protein
MLCAMSELAHAALSRRFFIGPLIAVALFGAGPVGSYLFAKPSPSASASAATPTPADPASKAKELILLAHEAEGVYFVDNLVYAAAAGGELQTLQGIEPNVAWGSDVIVESPKTEGAGAEVVIVRAPISTGGSLCIAEVSEVQDADTWYARVSGKAHCPPRRPGMPGWTTDQAKGWRL